MVKPPQPHWFFNSSKHYFIQTRQTHRIWKCVGCRETFSLTSGTVFASHKLPLKTYLAAVAGFKRQKSMLLSDLTGC